MYKIMIVEDEPVISRALEKALQGWGYEAVRLEQFDNVYEDFKAIRPDLILMDLYLPGRNGFYWTEKIREISSLPILFLSSADESMSVVTALTKGADDYITKPFDNTVLITKIQALLRRAYTYAPAAPFLEHKGLRLLPSSEVQFGGRSLELTKNEYRILHTLMEKKNAVVSRDTLMEVLWKTDCYIDENTLSVNINRLRKKLRQIGAEDYILTRKGQGYMV